MIKAKLSRQVSCRFRPKLVVVLAGFSYCQCQRKFRLQAVSLGLVWIGFYNFWHRLFLARQFRLTVIPIIITRVSAIFINWHGQALFVFLYYMKLRRGKAFPQLEVGGRKRITSFFPQSTTQRIN